MTINTLMKCLLCIYINGLLYSSAIDTLKPKVTRMIPLFGPVAGGTIIVLVGQNLAGLQDVFFDNGLEKFRLLQSNDSTVICQSVNVSESLSGHEAPLLLVLNGSEYNTTTNFTFRPNPVIHRVQPMRGIIRGGIPQTITGEHLDSVAFPLMKMILKHNRITYVQSDYLTERDELYCRVENSTCMICKSKPVRNSPINPLPGWNPLRSLDYKFWISFLLDGISYNYNHEFVVYQNPKFNGFDKQVLPFRVYNGQKEIDIWGQYFNADDDYTIIVGNGTTPSGGDSRCVMTYMVTNRIRCQPPQERPYNGGIHRNGQPQVIVKVGYLREHLGYLDYQLTPWDNPDIRTAVASVVCGLVILVIIVIIVIFVRRRSLLSGGSTSNVYSPPPDLWTRLYPQMRNELKLLLKNHDRLRLGSELGEGHFGSVYSAKFATDDGKVIWVAAKTIKDTMVTRRELNEFLQEATMMKNFHHPNVLGLVGVVFQGGRPFVLIPYMEKGDLAQYIRNPNNRFFVTDLLKFGVDIAKGMSYISEKKFVHRDLAARNCVVDSDDTVKIADFGLARDIHGSDYYTPSERSPPLPFRWMAIECFDGGKFTVYSDVWSFGVVLWELMTRGKMPYADIDSSMLKRFLQMGRRLDIPSCVPDNVAEVMRQCWQESPRDRPTFDQIGNSLQSAVDANSDAHQNVPGYEQLRRNVSPEYDNQRYQNIEVLSDFDQVDQTQSSASDARAAFGNIPDPDGYLQPVNGRVNDRNLHLNERHEILSHDNPAYEGHHDLQQDGAGSGYIPMDGCANRHH